MGRSATTANNAFFLGCAAVLILAGCATSEEVVSERQFREERVEEILALPLDPVEFGETKRCLNDTEYRNFRALDDQRILFYGRRDKYWINTLRNRCPDLRWGDVLVMRRFSGTRMCSMDTFSVADWFDWPWYRRWPWRWGTSWNTGMNCMLGEFQPVTEAQVDEIRAVLKR